MSGENLGEGEDGRSGCVIVDASGEREDAMRARAFARDVGEGERSISKYQNQ